MFKKFKYKDESGASGKYLAGKVVTVSIDMSHTSELSDAARKRVQKNMVEVGANYKDDTGKPFRIPPLKKSIRQRFGFAHYKTVYVNNGVIFFLFDCDESKDNPSVRIMQQPL